MGWLQVLKTRQHDSPLNQQGDAVINARNLRLLAATSGIATSLLALSACGANSTENNRQAQKSSLDLTGPNGYPYCTNGSNTGSGYGWDTSVTDPRGSHSCLVPAAAAAGANGYPYCTNGSNTGSGYGWDTSVTDPHGSHSCLVPSTPASSSTNASTPAGACSVPASLLPSYAAPGSTTQFGYAGSLSQLPYLSGNPSNQQLKQFVSTVYSLFPAFASVYETDLGLTKNVALAFMFADMSRESAAGHYWQMNIETGQGGPGRAYGPFQAAVTNFRGGGYDSAIEDYTGLPIPSMNQFYDPATITYAGMKRLADGILNSMRTFGAGQPAQKYLLGSLADHNTGWVTAANDPNWLNSYGNETLRLMRGYAAGSNLTNNSAFWTGESAGDFCSPQ